MNHYRWSVPEAGVNAASKPTVPWAGAEELNLKEMIRV